MENRTIVYDAKYDILKFILSLLVVAIHAELYPQVLYPWLRIAVPLFFIMTAYFLFSRLKGAGPEEQGRILKNFFLRNARLYLFWFVVLLPLTLYIRREQYFAGGLLTGLGAFARSVLFGSTFVASWYITAAVAGVFLIRLLTKYLGKTAAAVISLAAFAGVTMLSSYSAILLKAEPVEQAVTWYKGIFGDPVVSFPASLIWIFIGKCFAEQPRRPVRRGAALSVLILSAAALYAEWRLVRGLDGSVNNDSYFMLLPFCTVLFRYVRSLPVMTVAGSGALRRASTVIYAAHGTLVYAFGFVFRRLLQLDSPPAVFAAALAGCLVLYAVISCLLRRWGNNRFVRLLKNAY